MCLFDSLFSFLGDCWEFSTRHPGIVLVLVGVLGEGLEIFSKLFFKHWYEKNERNIDIWSGVFWIVVILGLAWEIPDAAKTDREAADDKAKSVALEQQIEDAKTNITRIDPANLPVLNINAFVKLRVKGKDFPDLTQWDSIPLSTNWGSKRATLTFCGNSPNSVLSSSTPTMIADDFGIGMGFPDFREYFLNFRMESVSAAMNLPIQSASKTFSAANFISINVKFLPPQSEILDGYAFVVVNNAIWKLFSIYPQKDTREPFPDKERAEILSKIAPLKLFERVVITGQKDAVAGTKISTLEPGKFTFLTNGEVVLFPATFFPSDFPIVGTNVPSGRVDLNW